MGLCQSDHGMSSQQPWLGSRHKNQLGVSQGDRVSLMLKWYWNHLPDNGNEYRDLRSLSGDMGTSAGDREKTGTWQWRGSQGTLTGTLLDTGGAKAVFQRVDLHFVGGRVIEHERRTCVSCRWLHHGTCGRPAMGGVVWLPDSTASGATALCVQVFGQSRRLEKHSVNRGRITFFKAWFFLNTLF